MTSSNPNSLGTGAGRAARARGRCAGLAAAVAAGAALAAGPASAQKTLLMHYMPWYITPDVRGVWGGHWTGFAGEANPDTLAADGLPDIWSHYDPLIGLYDSSDPDVLECHLLQMKLAGVDGVLPDWYGISGSFDYGEIHEATEALYEACERFDMQFAAVFEDRTIEARVNSGQLPVSQVRAELVEVFDWMEANWFGGEQYFRLNGRPLVLNFGPIYVQGFDDWNAALDAVAVRPRLYTLPQFWRNLPAEGGYTWINFSLWDGNPSTAVFRQRVTDWHVQVSGNPSRVIPGVTPGFDDIYAQSLGSLDYRGGETIRQMLDVAMDGPWEVIQLITWNDYGEGTMIEPTVQFGYQFLEIIQARRAEELGAAFTFTPDDLRLPTELYTLRKAGTVDDATLDVVSQLISDGDTAGARGLLLALSGGLFEATPLPRVVDAGGALEMSVPLAGGLTTLPGIDLRWERDGLALIDGGRVSGATTTTLTIDPADPEDTGLYRLVADASGVVSSTAEAIGAVRTSPLGVSDINADGVKDLFDILVFFSRFSE